MNGKRFPIVTPSDEVFPFLRTRSLRPRLYEYDVITPFLVPHGGSDHRTVNVSEVTSPTVMSDGGADGSINCEWRQNSVRFKYHYI